VTSDLTTVSTLATSSDEQLVEKLKPYAVQASQSGDALAYLRRGVLEMKPSDPLVIARMRLRELLQETLRDQARQERQAAKTETGRSG